MNVAGERNCMHSVQTAYEKDSLQEQASRTIRKMKKYVCLDKGRFL